MTFYDDAPNIHFPGISGIEFLVHALSITNYHGSRESALSAADCESAKHACKNHTVSTESYIYLLLSKTWFGYW